MAARKRTKKKESVVAEPLVNLQLSNNELQFLLELFSISFKDDDGSVSELLAEATDRDQLEHDLFQKIYQACKVQELDTTVVFDGYEMQIENHATLVKS